MKSSAEQIVGVVLFFLLWLYLLRSKWPSLPLGRSIGSVLCGCLYVCFGLLTPEEAYSAVDIPTLTLLTGCMIISAHAEKAGLYGFLAQALERGGGGPKTLLFRISFFSGVSSAFITNDTACLIIPGIVIQTCRNRKFSPLPYLIATATAANIGSSFSPLGNPQNMIIAIAGQVKFSSFLSGILVASFLGLIINALVIMAVYREHFFPSKTECASPHESGKMDDDSASLRDDKTFVADTVVDTSSPGKSFSSGSTSAPHSSSPAHAESFSLPPAPGSYPPSPSISNNAALTYATFAATTLRGRWTLLLLGATPIALVVADQFIGLGWTTMLIGMILFIVQNEPPDALLERVDGKLLLFFAGWFVSVGGLSSTGIPGKVWDIWLGDGDVLRDAPTFFSFIAFVLLGSNTISNVPLVLLLAPKIVGPSKIPWVVLAFVSTVSGNLTLLGSVANIIVAEVASRQGVEVHFSSYLKVGVPSTLLILMLLSPLVLVCGKI